MTVDKLLSQIVEYMPQTTLPCRYSISHEKTFTLFADDGVELFSLNSDGLQSYVDVFDDEAFDEMKIHINSDLKTYDEFRQNELSELT